MSALQVYYLSLGCDKNLVDAEYMLGLLRERGYTFTDDESEADVIVINTCCFIHDACEESIRAIIDMASYKENGKCKALIVTGCLGTRYLNEMHGELPEVDAIVTASAYDSIADVIDGVLAGQKQDAIKPSDHLPLCESGRILTTGGHYAYLKIAEGCDKHCTYCVIPSIRGPYRSVPMERLIKEAKELVTGGVRELILVAQETTLYGIDLYGHKALCELLEKLAQIEDLSWIRLLYCYPEEIDDDLIRLMQKEKKICHYLDMPVQHASDTILKRMGRKTDRASLVALIQKLRKSIPDICIRTTLITGFPGETEDDFQQLSDFVEEIGFDRLGVFPYSREEGTPACDMKDQVDPEIAQARQEEIMLRQQEICFQKGEDSVGSKLRAFVEGRVVGEDVYLARTYRDAPDVDGCLFIRTERELMSGDLVDVVVTGAHEYDLIGELADESAE